MTAPDPDHTDGPYAAAATTYWQAGWRGILPLPARAKKPVPTGWTGRDGAWPSYPDVQAWTEDRGTGNLALRLPPDVLGVDVDNYADKPGGLVLAQLETEHGPLPATWRTTSRDDGTSGIRLYRIPVGLRWPGILGPGIETIRHEHRYAVAWPSIHPEGGTYRWIRPDGTTSLHDVPTIDDLPDLPAAWIAHFTGGELATDQPKADLTSNAATAWLAQRGAGVPCRHTQTALTRGTTDITAGGSRHDATLALTNRLIWLAGEGHTGAVLALQAAKTAFMAATAGDRGPDEAGLEWGRMVDGAVRMAAAAHPTPSPDPCTDPFAGLILRKDQPCPPTTPPPAPTTSTSSTPAPTASAPESSTTTTANDPAVHVTGEDTSTASAPAQASTDAATTEADGPPPSWGRADLTAYLDGTYQPVEPAFLPREDGVCLVYPGLTHSFHGESESGKSMVLQYEAARLIALGQDVLYVDFESDAASVTERLTMFGATRDQILSHFDYRNPDVSPQATPGDLAAWSELLTGRYALAVVDGVTDSLGVFGLSTKDNDEIAKWMRILPRQIAAQTGAGVVVIDHVTKDTENRGRFAIGGQAKLAGLSGAAYTVEIAQPLGRGLKGVIVLRVGKDRPGFIRGHSAPMRADRTQEAARVIVDSTGERTTVRVEARSGADVPLDARPPMRFTGIMEKVSRTLEAAGEPLSIRALRERVGGNKDRLASALADLVAGGFVDLQDGPRGATMHSLTRAYRQRTDPLSDLFDPLDPAVIEAQNTPENPTVADRGSTVADRGPATVRATVAPAPHPEGGRATVAGDRDQSTVAGKTITRIVAGKRVQIDTTTGEVLEP